MMCLRHALIALLSLFYRLDLDHRPGQRFIDTAPEGTLVDEEAIHRPIELKDTSTKPSLMEQKLPEREE
jgi:hypothetical protein